MWRYHFTPEQHEEHFKIRVSHLTKLISVNPRGSLIVGTHAELKTLYPLLITQFPNHNVLLYNDNENLVKNMKNETIDWSKIIILGSEKMYIGLNLPGCIGLVAILRSLNEPPKQVDKKYSEIIGLHNDVKYNERIQHIRLMKQMQAIGRIMRCHTDYGVVAFLSHHPDDVTYVKHYYKDAIFVKELKRFYENNAY